VNVEVGVGVSVGDVVTVGVSVGVAVSVSVPVMVGVPVAVSVGVGVAVAVSVGVEVLVGGSCRGGLVNDAAWTELPMTRPSMPPARRTSARIFNRVFRVCTMTGKETSRQ
jgi:hypothetical protein